MKTFVLAVCGMIGLMLFAAGCLQALENRKRRAEPRPWIARLDLAGFTWGVTAHNGEELHACHVAFNLPGEALERYQRARLEFAEHGTPTGYKDAEGGRWLWVLDINGKDVEFSSQSFASQSAARRNYELVRVAVMAHEDPLYVR